jgi:hypothetical protein
VSDRLGKGLGFFSAIADVMQEKDLKPKVIDHEGRVIDREGAQRSLNSITTTALSI